jgi:hypothetical protein
MADRISYSVSVTPIETIAGEETSITNDIIASEIGKSFSGNGTAAVTNYSGTAANQGYKDRTVNYKEAEDDSDAIDLVDGESTATFIYIKNTGYAFNSATVLGAALNKSLKIMAPGGTTLISILDPGEAIVLKDDNAGLDGKFHVRTVDLDGSNNTDAGHLAVEYLVVD